MASTKEYLDFVLGQLASDVTFRAMMGEYVLYCHGRVVGGIYDNRLLLKPTESALRLLRENGMEPQMEIPYEGAKPMLTADIDNPAFTCRMIEAVAGDVPEPKRKKTGKRQTKKT